MVKVEENVAVISDFECSISDLFFLDLVLMVKIKQKCHLLICY